MAVLMATTTIAARTADPTSTTRLWQSLSPTTTVASAAELCTAGVLITSASLRREFAVCVPYICRTEIFNSQSYFTRCCVVTFVVIF